ncbi:MAG: ROK family protein [Caulobacterales bacterium]
MKIGLDLGGTKIEAAAVDSEGKIHFRHRISTPADYSSLVKSVAELARAAANQSGAKLQIGIGMPGSESPATGLVRNSNTQYLNGKPLKRDLEAAIGGPVRLANDANCFTLSEALSGAGAGARSVFGVIMGTGCGGGVVIDGKLIEGANLIAGEWGHTPLPWQTPEEYPGATCFCGRKGCLELWLSGTGFETDYKRLSGEDLDGREIAARAMAGEALANKALERLTDRLARALAVVADIFDPEVIVLGGGLSNVEAIYPLANQKLPIHAFSDCYKPRIVKNQHGDSSGVRGAAWLWPDE